jgi:hypothetical protein
MSDVFIFWRQRMTTLFLAEVWWQGGMTGRVAESVEAGGVAVSKFSGGGALGTLGRGCGACEDENAYDSTYFVGSTEG